MIGSPIKPIIELTEADAKLFIAFQANYVLFETLVKSGVLDIKNGKAVLNFNAQGQLADVELQYHTYRLGK